jgi:hypothetical protein
MLPFLSAIVGAALLLLGRKIFWLFIGGLGFVAGLQLAAHFLHGPESITLLVGLALGVALALLAIFLETLAIGVAGFLAGGYTLVGLAGMLGLERPALTWLIYLIGGIAGIVLVTMLFNWAIISLSSLAGASMIVAAFPVQRGLAGLVFLVLVLIGVVVQATAMRREDHPERHEE